MGVVNETKEYSYVEITTPCSIQCSECKETSGRGDTVVMGGGKLTCKSCHDGKGDT